jgi:pyruvate dehydrogenase E2 component (dihydrolipoamide acetyltransferase)
VSKFSFTAYVVRACGLALRDHPLLNAEYTAEGVRFHRRINIGVAVSAPEGLIVPVIPDADAESLADIHRQILEYRSRSEHMRFPARMLTGGTFTITNLGMFGVDRFKPIINPPQSAILAVGRIRDVAVEGDRGEARFVRSAVMTLVADHRVIDGVQGARFLVTLAGLLEDPRRIGTGG